MHSLGLNEWFPPQCHECVFLFSFWVETRGRPRVASPSATMENRGGAKMQIPYLRRGLLDKNQSSEHEVRRLLICLVQSRRPETERERTSDARHGDYDVLQSVVIAFHPEPDEKNIKNVQRTLPGVPTAGVSH
jgi:hypothetical protein